MRRSPWVPATLLLMAVAPGARAADTPPAVDRHRPKPSGFFDFRDASAEFASGLGTIPGLTCTIDSSTQPSIYAGNLLLDCDGENPHNETTIAVDPLDPDHAIGGFHTYLLTFNGSTVIAHIVGTTSVTFDGGRSWRQVIPPMRPYQSSGDPALAFDSRGRAYFATLADHEGETGNFTGPDIIVRLSGDGGLAWSLPVVLAEGLTGQTPRRTAGPTVFNDKPFIAVDGRAASPFRDRAYVTWTRFSQFFNPRGGFFQAPIMLSSSDDGATWSAGRTISGRSPALCTAALSGAPGDCDLNQDSYPSVAPGGRVYVGFENFNTPAENQILVVSSDDGGATWSDPARVDHVEDLNFPQNVDGRNTLTGCQLRYGVTANSAADPSDPSGRTVYVVWADNRNGSVVEDPSGTKTFTTNTDVFLGRSSDGGQTWQVIPVDTAANDQFYPWVAVAPGGRVDVGYMDRSYSAGQEECRYGFALTRISFDGGGHVASLSKSRVDTGLSDPGASRWFGLNSRFIGDYNGIAIDSTGATWSLWTDQRATVSSTSTRHGQHAVGAVTE